MYINLIIMVFLAPIWFSTSKKLVERKGGFNNWMRHVSIYTLVVGFMMALTPVVLEVMNLQWFADFKEILRDDVLMNLKAHSRALTVLCYVVRQVAIMVSTGAVCLATVQLVCRYGKADKLVAVLVCTFAGILVVIRAFHMPVDDGEFYQKLFAAIEWVANRFWFFIIGIFSFCAGILVMGIKQRNQHRC